jgi:BASS family bile acid:Na+ symporter
MDEQSPLILVLVVAIMASALASGFGTRLGAARRLLDRPGPLVAALALLLLVMPALAILVAWLLPLAPEARIALIALFLSPLPPFFPGRGGPRVAPADDIIGAQLLAALAAIAVAPLSLLVVERLTDHVIVIDKPRMILVLLLTIIAPLAIGMVVNHWRPALADAIRQPLARVAAIVLAGGVVLLLFGLGRSLLAAFTLPTLLAFVLVAGLGLVLGHLVGRPDRERQRTLAIAMVTRHPGVALILSASVTAVPPERVVPFTLLLFLLGAAAGLLALRLPGDPGSS